MDTYYIDSNEENRKNPFFIWFIIVSDMLQLFNDLQDLRNICMSAEQKGSERINPIFLRVFYGYHNEFQSTIRMFLLSKQYCSLLDCLKEHHPYMYKELSSVQKEWKTKYQEYSDKGVSVKPHEYFNQIRNSYFHFASREEDCSNYMARYELMLRDVKDGDADKHLIFSIDEQTDGTSFHLEKIRDFLNFYVVACSFSKTHKQNPIDANNRRAFNQSSVDAVTDSYKFIADRCLYTIWNSLFVVLLDEKTIKYRNS